MPNNLPSINLVKNKQTPLIDKFMNWALTVGRLIVIITEVVAVIAFVYRFSLDDQLVDLHDVIKNKQAMVSVLKNDENKYRNLQDRIALAATFSANGVKSNQSITDIANLMSFQVKINELILNKDRENMRIEVVSPSALSNFIEALKKSRNIKSISIDNIESKPLAGLSVDITVMLK